MMNRINALKNTILQPLRYPVPREQRSKVTFYNGRNIYPSVRSGKRH